MMRFELIDGGRSTQDPRQTEEMARQEFQEVTEYLRVIEGLAGLALVEATDEERAALARAGYKFPGGVATPPPGGLVYETARNG